MTVINANKKKSASRISIWLEAILMLMMVGGIYFIKSDIDLAAIFRDAGVFMQEKIAVLELWSIAFYNTAIEQIELSDIVGIIIIGWALVLGVMRFRHRLVNAFTLPDVCPECGSTLMRNHRTILQRFISRSLALNSISFYCSECKEKNHIFRYKVKATT